MKPTILTKVWGMLGRRPASSPSVRVQHLGATGSYGSFGDYRSPAALAFEQNSDVHACIDLILTNAAQVKWWSGDGGTKALGGSSVASGNPKASLDVLERSGSQVFVRDWFFHMLLYGNAFSEITRADVLPSRLYTLQPDRVSPVRNPRAVFDEELVDKWRIVDASGHQYTRDPWRNGRGDIVHARQVNPSDPIMGLAPLQAAMLHVQVQNESLRLTNQTLQRGHAPGWIKADPESEWNENQLAALADRTRTAKLSGNELFLQHATWNPMGFEVMTPGMVDLQEMGKRNICSVFHVDPVLIGDTSSRTFATYAQSRQSLFLEAILPGLSLFCDSWNTTIGAELNSPLYLDKDSFDTISNTRAEATDRAAKGFQTGMTTRNEARAELEYDPRPDGDSDTFYMPANQIRVEKTKEEE